MAVAITANRRDSVVASVIRVRAAWVAKAAMVDAGAVSLGSASQTFSQIFSAFAAATVAAAVAVVAKVALVAATVAMAA